MMQGTTNADRARRTGIRGWIGRGLVVTAMVVVAAVASGTLAVQVNAKSYDKTIYLQPDLFAMTSFTTATSDVRAGAHPDVNTAFAMKAELREGTAYTLPYGRVRRVEVDMPVGLTANPAAIPTCRMSDFYKFGLTPCPKATQVGVTTVTIAGGSFGGNKAVYNMERPPNEPVILGMKIDTTFWAFVRVESTPDGKLTAIVDDVPMGHPLKTSDLTLWGVPADHNGSGAPRVPFMTGPTECVSVPTTTQRVFSYEGFSDSAVSTDPIATECDAVPFKPEVTVTPTERAAGVPTGLDVSIKVPQNDLPDGRATAHVDDVKVALPVGMWVSSAAADGLAGCSPAAFGLESRSADSCPDGSKIGTVAVHTPLLEKPMHGSVYLAEQTNNPFGSLIALYLTVEGAGVRIKLAGRVDPDPVTGRLTATFEDNPQLPFERMDLAFKSGPRAPLVTPLVCGTYQTESTVSSWAGHSVSGTSPMTVDRNCGGSGRFDVSLAAGLENPVAGSSSTFTMSLDVPSGQQNLERVALGLPEGVLGMISSVPLCPEAQAAAGTCSDASRVGRVVSGVGLGSAPLFVPQAGKTPTKVFLAGGYKGAPYSLSMLVPAQAGPFDLGNVVVRAALYVDPHDAHVTAIADPLPQILQGIPLRYQKVNVQMDRLGFMLAPTSCQAKQITSNVVSSTGTVAYPGSRLQVGGCANLPLKPKMQMVLKGKKEVKRGKHPTLATTLTQAKGESALKRVQVRLPLSLALDPDNAQALCKPQEAEAKTCPKGSIVGKATAISPVLNRPLSGDVFFVEGTRLSKEGRTVKTLPKLWVALRGEVAIDLWADSSLKDGKYLVTTFPFVPDAPISKFEIDIDGGKHGILAVTGGSGAHLCKQALSTRATFDGQSGKRVVRNVAMSAPCGFAVRESSLTKTHARVTVSGLGKGRLSISGKGVLKASRSIKRASVATIKPRLSAAGMRAARGGKAVRVSVAFKPAKTGTKTKRTRASAKQPKAASSRSR